MLQDLDRTLETILREDGKLPKKDIDIAFEQPTSEWSAKISRPTLNLWAFDLRENVKLRRADAPRVQSQNGRTAVYTRPPRPIDVSYLVTAWARKPEDEHALLWRALRVLKSMGEIPKTRLEGELSFAMFPPLLTVADMSNQSFNLSDLWSVLENQMKLGFLMISTLELSLDYRIETPLVLEGTFTVEQIVSDEAPPAAPDKPPVQTRRTGRTADTEDVQIVHYADSDAEE